MGFRRRPSNSRLTTFALLFALSRLPTSLAVTLSDFQPSCSNLTPQCQTVYAAPITGCTPNDFSGSGCSANCIAGMLSISSSLFNACAGDTQNTQNIVAAFLVGEGVSALCPNVAVSTSNNGGGPSATTIVESTPSSSAPSTTSASSPDSYGSASVTSAASSSSTIDASTPLSTSSTPTSTTSTPVSTTVASSTATSSSANNDHPPTTLTGTGVNSFSTPPPASATSDCLSGGGGGSLVGQKACSAASPSFSTRWGWTEMAAGVLGSSLLLRLLLR